MKSKNPIISFFTELDSLLVLFCAAASVFGVLCVISATRRNVGEGDLISRDARTMILAVAAGLVAALVISMIDYSIICRLWPLIAGGCLLLMLLVFLFGVGPSQRQDAKTWLAIGSRFYFQPSELLKVGFAVTFAVHLDTVSDKLNKPLHVLLLLIHAGVPALLVMRSGDMGSALIFILMALVMLFAAGLKLRYFFGFFLVLCAAVPLAWKFVLKDLQKERILGLIYPDRYPDIMYQQNHGITAIVSGGFTGKGLFRGGLTGAGYVPESENDMIFSVVGEELGFIGCVCALLLLFLIVFRIGRGASRCRSGEGRLMCAGICAMIASQVLINIGMCLKLLPVIGITLPFFSAGGSSNLCIYIGIGLVLSVCRYSIEHEAENFRLGFIEGDAE